MLAEMHVVKFSGAIAAMRNTSDITFVRRLRETRADDGYCARKTATGASVGTLFRPDGADSSLTHSPTADAVGFILAPLRGWKSIVNFRLPFRRAWYLSQRSMTFVTLSSRYLPPTIAME